MACNAAMGTQSRLCFEAITPGGAFTTSAIQIAVLRETLSHVITVKHSEEVRGTRSVHTNRSRESLEFVRGSIWFHPDVDVLDGLAEYILGGAESTDTFDVAEGLTSIDIGVDLDSGASGGGGGTTGMFQFDECYIDRAVFSGQAGGFLECRLDIVGKTANELTADWPAISLLTADISNQPFVFEDSDGENKFGGTAFNMRDFRVTIDNHIRPRYTNATQATSFCPAARTVLWECTTPFYSAAERNLLTSTPTTGQTGALKFTNSTVSFTISCPDLRLEPRTPHIPGKSEIWQKLRFTGRRTDATDMIQFIIDETV